VKVTEILNNFAISSDGIATALQDSASSLMAANNSYEEAVALIAAANRVVQDPNSVGSALRTISLRLRGTSVKELEEAGEDTTGAITSQSKLRGKIKSLSGVDILTDTGAYKSTYDILLEISKVWKDISDIDQAALLEILAGKNRANTAAAILSNTKDLEEAYASAMEAEGSAWEENEKYLDSIQGRIDLFTNSVQTMWSNALDSDLVKIIVDVGTGLINVVDQLGLVKTLIFTIGTYLIQKHFNGDLFGGLFGESIADMKSHLKTLEDELKTAEAKYKKNPNKKNAKRFDQSKQQYEKYKKAVEPQIEEYDNLEKKLKSLKDTRQSLSDELTNSQAQEEFAAARMAAGYENAAKELDNASANTKKLEGQITQLDQEIINTDVELKKVEKQANATGTAGLTAGQKFKAGFKTAWSSVTKFGKEILKSMAYSMAMTAVLESIAIIGGWIGDAWDAFKPKTFEDLQEELEQTESEISNVESEIRNLNSELDDTNERIEELTSKGSLSYVEQEELSRLKSATAELEAQIALKKTLQDSKQAAANGQAVAANEAYLNTSFMSDQTKTERQEKKGETGEEIGKVAGTVIGALVAAAIITASGGTLTPVALAAGAGIGNMLGGPLGKITGEAIAGASYDSEQTVGEAMDNMIATRKELKKAQDEALADRDTEAYNEATEALTTYDNQMAKHISQIQANYNAMDWETATEEQKKEMMEYADWLSRYSISMGTTGAKSSAIERIFGGAEASQELKDIDQQIKNTIASGKEVDFHEIFNDDSLAETKQRLYDMGLTVTDLKYYYLDWKEAEEDVEGATYNVVQSVSALSDGIGALKDAFGEFKEEGMVTADTLVALYDTFGSLGDAWDNYVDIMATGTSSTKDAQKATEELLEAFMNARLDKGPITDIKDYLSLIGQLQSLGVTNAKGYVDALQRASMISGIGKAVVNDKNEDGKTQDELIRQYTQQYEEQYGITLSDEERLAIEKAITAEKAKQAATEAAKKHSEHEKAVYEKEKAEEALQNAQSELEKVKSEGETKKVSEVGSELNDGGSLSIWSYNGEYYTDGNTEVQYVDPKVVKEAEKAVKEAEEKVGSIDVPVDVNVDDAEKKAKDAEDTYQQALDNMGLTLQIELINAEQAVDDIQSVYDALMDAATEYNEKGYFSVDTLQSLLSLEPKYLTMLMNEQGQLEFNKQAILNVAQARIFDMTQKQIDSIITNASNAAKNGEIDKLDELTSALYGAADARHAFNISGMAELRTNLANPELGLSQAEQDSYYNSIQSQIEAAIAAYEHTISNLPKALYGGGSSTSGDPDENAALEALQKKYERQIENLDNQQTYIENEIEKLEAEEEGVSKSYYEKQIKLEQDKIDLYEQEREALKKLDMTDEVAAALWEVEHAIQESTLRMIEFRKSIIELYNTAFENIGEKFDDKGQLIDDAKSYLEGYMDLFDIQGELAHPDMYDDLIAKEQEDRQNNVDKLAAQQELYDQFMNSANPFEEGSEKAKQYEEDRNAAAIKMQADMHQTELDILENDKALAQFNEDLKNLYLEGWDKVREAFDNKGSFIDNQLGYIESYISRLETLNIDVPESAYDEMIARQRARNADNQNQLNWEYEELERLKREVGEDDEQYHAKLLEVAQLETETYEGQTKVLEWEQKILDSRFEKFEQLIGRIDDSINELNNISDLMSDDDVAYEDGSWTAEGISRAGLAFQEMEMQKQVIEECNEQLEEQKRLLDAGEISQDKYYENTQAIKDAQWSAIKAYEAAEDAIIDLNEARIDMIEEGMNKEIEAYQELIDLKKEELDAERDLYNFRKDIQKQTKDISTLERRIASMSGSTDAATIAERIKLEAELRDAREGLDDTYYNHAMDSQAKALDDEMESFEKSKMDYLENLRESIKETDLVVEQTYQNVMANADVVLDTLVNLSTEKGFTINENLINPWINASTESVIFKNTVHDGVLSLINESGVITLFGQNAPGLLSSAFGAGSGAAWKFKTDVESYVGLIKNFLTTESPELQKYIDQPWKNPTKENGSVITFSDKVKELLEKAVADAKSKQEGQYGTLEGILKSPWDNAQSAITNWYLHVEQKLNDALTKARNIGAEIEKELTITTPNYIGNGKDSDGGGYNPGGGWKTVTASLKTALGTFTAMGYGTESQAKSNAKEDVISQAYRYYKSKGYRDEHLEKVYRKMWDQNVTFYAKGTLGTKKDDWAITDEIGDELVMYATPQGTLSYMRAGSTVVPADITENLIEWGKLNPNMDSTSTAVHGVNLMSNVINKPETNLTFDSLLHIDNCSKEVIPEVKKIITEQLENFTRKLNYNLKRVGST